ncbi:hypothetical protein JA1_004821 [Spathaspora sp. JA1]|nr:hypothetical protein JA1_004821 [Spathaspora sp. JA1]
METSTYLVKHIVLYIENPNAYSQYCYSQSVQKFFVARVDVDSSNRAMFEKQFARIHKITQLRVQNDFSFKYDFLFCSSLKELYITNSKNCVTDTYRLIGTLKETLTLLYIDDNGVKDIIDHFNKWKISGLKLKKLALRVPELSLERMNEVFVLDEIVSFELHFYNDVSPYKSLKRLCSSMKKLRSINISWCNFSFEKVMQQLLGLRLYKIRLENYGREEREITAPEVESLLQGHDLVTLFGISNGIISTGEILHSERSLGSPELTPAVQNFYENFNKKKFPKIQIVCINNLMCFM